MKKYIIVFFVFVFACSKNNTPEYKNVIDIAFVPQKIYNIKQFGFSDMGAWHGYNLVPKDSTQYYGAFTGPLVMKMYGQWLSKAFNQLKVYDGKGREVDLTLFDYTSNYYPGRLEQRLTSDKYQIDMTLFFVSNRTAIQKTTVRNLTQDKRKLQLIWKSELMNPNFGLTATANNLFVWDKKSESYFQVKYSAVTSNAVSSDSTYATCEESPFELEPNQSYDSYNTQSYFLDKSEDDLELKNKSMNEIFTAKLKENKQRWNGYILSYMKNIRPEYDSLQYKKIAVKSIMTLVRNWRSPAGDLKHDGVFPSASYQGFYGFWSWDTWKHSVAFADFFPELAKSGMFSMFDYQDERGMVADCIYYDKSENNWRDTKAPLSAWAAWNIYERSQDLEFVKKIYPMIVKYHKWWYTDRDYNKNGICEYGSTDGTLIAAKWESGMDNAIRFDETKIIKTTEKAWSFNQESVDLNAYLWKEKFYMDKLAKVLGEEPNFAQNAQPIADFIEDKMFDQELGYYFDINSETQERIKTFGPEGWTSLWVKMSDKKRADLVIEKMLDTKIFNSKVPLPTIDIRHERFNPRDGYWRGPVWLDQFYFGIAALRNYGYANEATSLVKKLFHNGEGIMDQGRLRENYHPITGEGLNANDFSWSAAHILMMMSNQ